MHVPASGSVMIRVRVGRYLGSHQETQALAAAGANAKATPSNSGLYCSDSFGSAGKYIETKFEPDTVMLRSRSCDNLQIVSDSEASTVR